MAEKEYIEREALRNKLYDEDAITMKGIAIINQFPVADVLPVVEGKWIKKHDSIRYWYVCSRCGMENPRTQQGVDWHSTFCPACGAKLK